MVHELKILLPLLSLCGMSDKRNTGIIKLYEFRNILVVYELVDGYWLSVLGSWVELEKQISYFMCKKQKYCFLGRYVIAFLVDITK
jgi:hypothetical protein